MTVLFSFKMFDSLGGAKSYIMLNARWTIYTYLNVRFSMNRSIVISSSRTKSTIPGSSRVAMVDIFIFLSGDDTLCRWVGMLVLGTCDIFIADSTDTYLFRVGNVGTTVSRAREKRPREFDNIIVVRTRTVEQRYILPTAHYTETVYYYDHRIDKYYNSKSVQRHSASTLLVTTLLRY